MHVRLSSRAPWPPAPGLWSCTVRDQPGHHGGPQRYGTLVRMPETVEIGLGRSARRGFHLADVALVPTRRTRGSAMVSTAWQIDAHTFELPFVAAPSDAVVSPATAVEVERLGGLAVLDGEGLWSRYDDPDAELAALQGDTAELQRVYSRPVSPDLLPPPIARPPP